MIRAVALCLLVAVAPVAAPALDLPQGARLLSERIVPLDSYALPMAAFDGNTVPARVFEGRVERRSWRIDGGSATPLQLLAPLRDQLLAEGFEILFECRADACGGFDFRFGTEVAPAPQMHVDIGDFRFLSAIRNDDEALSLLVSRPGNTDYMQEIHVLPSESLGRGGDSQGVTAGPATQPARAGSAAGDDAPPLIDVLLAEGHVILSDLDFQSGANSLGPGPHDSLARIAVFLAANPGYRLVLVGHTDSVGALEANIALSKRRAEAVRDRLVGDYGVAPERVAAEGMGYLAPVASNLTAEGREKNRRVEAVVLPAG